MPYKAGKLKGELTSAELRKLIRAHNILVSIKIPKGTDRDGLIKLIEKNGYKIDHKNQKIVDKKTTRPRRPVITLEKAKELTKPKPVSEEEKKKRQQDQQKRKGEKAFLKQAIPKPPAPSKPAKGIKVGKPPPKKDDKAPLQEKYITIKEIPNDTDKERKEIKYLGEKIKILILIFKKEKKKEVYLALFKNNNIKKKGYGRYILCQLIEYLIKKKLVKKSNKFTLFPEDLKDEGGSQSKLENMYKQMGFNKGHQDEWGQSVGSFLKWCKTYKVK